MYNIYTFFVTKYKIVHIFKTGKIGEYGQYMSILFQQKRKLLSEPFINLHRGRFLRYMAIFRGRSELPRLIIGSLPSIYIFAFRDVYKLLRAPKNYAENAIDIKTRPCLWNLCQL